VLSYEITSTWHRIPTKVVDLKDGFRVREPQSCQVCLEGCLGLPSPVEIE
jgi:hypothetical protein